MREFHYTGLFIILFLTVFHIITTDQGYISIGVLYVILLVWSIVESKREDETEVK